LGRALLSERQQKMNRFLHILLRIAETCSVAVVITNQIQSSPDSLFGDPFRPTGGNIMGHTTTYRIYLKKAGKNRIARMADSPYHAEREVLFTLNEEGIGDPLQ
jgi:DNA repair protein RadA